MIWVNHCKSDKFTCIYLGETESRVSLPIEILIVLLKIFQLDWFEGWTGKRKQRFNLKHSLQKLQSEELDKSRLNNWVEDLLLCQAVLHKGTIYTVGILTLLSAFFPTDYIQSACVHIWVICYRAWYSAKLYEQQE